MRPPPFEYRRPETIAEALDLLWEHGDACRLLAGGQSLVPVLNLRMARPEIIIDLNRCAGLAHIDRNQSSIVCGAMTRQIEAQYSAHFIDYCPLVPQSLERGGPVAIRNRGTIGGVLAHADRSAELPAVAVALDATIVIERRDRRRELPAQEFFVTDLTTAIEANEMLHEVRFPLQPKNAVSCFLESGNRQRDMALAGVACQLVFDAIDSCDEARLSVIGVEGRPVRLSAVESHVVACSLDPQDMEEAGRIAADSVNPDGDVHASAEYRRHLVRVLVTRAITQAKSSFEKRAMI